MNDQQKKFKFLLLDMLTQAEDIFDLLHPVLDEHQKSTTEAGKARAIRASLRHQRSEIEKMGAA